MKDLLNQIYDGCSSIPLQEFDGSAYPLSMDLKDKITLDIWCHKDYRHSIPLHIRVSLKNNPYIGVKYEFRLLKSPRREMMIVDMFCIRLPRPDSDILVYKYYGGKKFLKEKIFEMCKELMAHSDASDIIGTKSEITEKYVNTHLLRRLFQKGDTAYSRESAHSKRHRSIDCK